MKSWRKTVRIGAIIANSRRRFGWLAVGALLLAGLALTLSSCMEAGEFAGEKAGVALSEQANGGSPAGLYTGGSREALTPTRLSAASCNVAEADVHAVIEPNGPGSWMKNAPWREVVFTIHNTSGQDLEITAVRGVSAQGVFTEQGGLGELGQMQQAASEKLTKDAAGSGYKGFLLSTLPMTALGMIPGVGALGYAGMSLVGGAAGGVGQGLMEGQINGQTGPIYDNAHDFQKIMNEYQSRQVQRARLAAGGSLVGSAFFPRSAGAIRELAFSLKDGTQDAELRVNLETAPTRGVASQPEHVPAITPQAASAR